MLADYLKAPSLVESLGALVMLPHPKPHRLGAGARGFTDAGLHQCRADAAADQAAGDVQPAKLNRLISGYARRRGARLQLGIAGGNSSNLGDEECRVGGSQLLRLKCGAEGG